MPDVVTRTYKVYTYDELDAQAQEKAREKWLESQAEDGDFRNQQITDDLVTTLEEEWGFELDTWSYSNSTFQHPDLYWDADRGAFVAWKGTVKREKMRLVLRKVLHGKTIRTEWPVRTWSTPDATPRTYIDVDGTKAYRILSGLLSYNSYALDLGTKTQQHGGGSMSLHAWGECKYEFEGTEAQQQAFAALGHAWSETVREIAGELLQQARNEIDYQYSEEYMKEDIEANEWKFLITGVPEHSASVYDIEHALEEEAEEEDDDADSDQ